MAEGRQRAEWRRTAEICSTLANCHRDPEQKPEPFTWDDFFPYVDEPDPTDASPPQRTSPEEMRQAFLGW